MDLVIRNGFFSAKFRQCLIGERSSLGMTNAVGHTGARFASEFVNQSRSQWVQLSVVDDWSKFE